MKYVVFEDSQSKIRITNYSDDTPVKIHKVTSKWYVNRKKDATTCRWSKPFDTAKEAEEYAERLGKPWKWARGARKT